MAIPAQLEDRLPEADIAEGVAFPAPAFVHADADERMLAPAGTLQGISERRRLVVLFGAFFALHVALLALFFATVGFDEPVTPEREIAVEVVQEPPPQPQLSPAEEKKPEPEPEKQQEAQQPPPPNLDMTPAKDAPRMANKETVDREAPDDKTQARQMAKPTTPGAGKTTDAPTETKATPSPDVGPATEKTAPDQPEAETIERAEAKPETLQRFTSPENATRNGAPTQTMEQMMAQLQPVPDYKFAGAAMPHSIGSGTAKPNYLSILYSIIVPKFRKLRPSAKPGSGQIAIVIDTAGNILHVGLVRPSGSVAVDNAALTALKQAAPFPRPPPGLPGITWTYE